MDLAHQRSFLLSNDDNLRYVFGDGRGFVAISMTQYFVYVDRIDEALLAAMTSTTDTSTEQKVASGLR